MVRHLISSSIVLSLCLQASIPALAAKDETPPPELSQELGLLERGTSEEKMAAARKLLARKDPELLPSLFKALSTDDRGLQRLIIEGMFKGFPQRNLDDVTRLLKRGDENQRVAGAYALCLQPFAEVRPLISAALRDRSAEVRRAGVYSTQAAIFPLRRIALERILLGEVSPTERQAADFAAIRDFVVSEMTARNSLAQEDLGILHFKIATEETAALVTDAYRKGLTGKDRAVGDLLERMRAASHAWLGRPTLGQQSRLNLELSAENYVTGAVVKQSLNLPGHDVDMLRTLGLEPLRGLTVLLPLDALALDPRRCGPELHPLEAAGQVEVRYRVPADAVPRLRYGSVGGTHFDPSSAPEVASARVSVETERAIPLEETFLDESGSEIGRVSYEDYQQLADGTWAPLTLKLFLDRTDNNRPGEHELHFTLLNGETWLLKSAESRLPTAEANVLRAGLTMTAQLRKR